MRAAPAGLIWGNNPQPTTLSLSATTTDSVESDSLPKLDAAALQARDLERAVARLRLVIVLALPSRPLKALWGGEATSRHRASEAPAGGPWGRPGTRYARAFCYWARRVSLDADEVGRRIRLAPRPLGGVFVSSD